MRIKLMCILGGLLMPCLAQAQGYPEEIHGLNDVLDNLFDEMLPMCEDLIDVGRVIAGFAAVFYIGFRVWRHIAQAEPVDFYPLMRPFVLGFCISIFPSVIALMNGVLYPTVAGTRAMVEKSNDAVEKLMEKREKELLETKAYKMYGVNDGAGDRDVWMKYTHSDQIGKEGIFGGIGNNIEFAMSKAYFSFKNMIKDFISFVLQLLFEGAALCINTMRTFNLLICAILGPFVFGLSVFDGLQHSLTVWIARYVNFYLWLPIANILGAMLGKIQEGMINLDLQQMSEYGETFFSTSDVGYLVFMLIGIVAYFTVPNLANLVVNAGGGSLLTSKMTAIFFGDSSLAYDEGAIEDGMAADAYGNNNTLMSGGYQTLGRAGGYFLDKLKG